MQSYNDDKKNDEKKKFNNHHSTYKNRSESTDDIDQSMSLQLHISTIKSASFIFDIDSTTIIVSIMISIIISIIVSIIDSIIVSNIVSIIASIIVSISQLITPHSLQQSVRQFNKYQLVSRDSRSESPHKSASSEPSPLADRCSMRHDF
jgi:hypothetical protein